MSGRRRRTQSRSAQCVVLNAMPCHGIASGRKAWISRASGFRRYSPLIDLRLERDHDDRRLEPRVEPDDLARLDDEARLLERLADGRLGHGLVDLEEAARLGPPALARLDAAAEQDDLAVVVDRDRRDDEARVDVGDVAARGAGESVAILALDGAELERVAAARAEVQASRRARPGRRRPSRCRSSARRGRGRTVTRSPGRSSRSALMRRGRRRPRRGARPGRSATPRPTRGGTGPCRDRPASTPRRIARSGRWRRRS